MIPYRFLTPAEEEMTEAALFYEAASSQLGTDFLDDVQRAIDRVCDYPQVGEVITSDFRRTLLHQFPFSLVYAIGEYDCYYRSRAPKPPTWVLAEPHKPLTACSKRHSISDRITGFS